MRVGVIGVGNMGGAMALRLLERGFAVAVRDVDAAREQAAHAGGASVCMTPAALASQCPVVVICVVDAAQTARVLFRDAGVVDADPHPEVVLLCPTIGPNDVEAFAARLAPHGVGVLDAPMSGGPARARDGSMSLIVAGAQALIERCGPVIEALSSRVFHVGARLGDAARTKLVNNLLAAVNLAGAAEALALAEAIGLDAARTLDVIEQSSGQSWIGSERLRRAIVGDQAPRAHTSLLRKDSALALALAARHGVPTAVGAQAAELFARACESGHAGLDDSSLWRYLSGSTQGAAAPESAP